MKFNGIVGFWEGEKEIKPGIWRPNIEERPYKGEVLKLRRGFREQSNAQNDEFTVSNKISILSDLYARQNWASIRYVVWNGVKWKVNNIDVDYPRLTLEIGGIYHDSNDHGQEEDTTS